MISNDDDSLVKLDPRPLDPRSSYAPVDHPMRRDPFDGKWERLDESPAASAQMIRWYAPQTWEAIVRAHDDFLEESL